MKVVDMMTKSDSWEYEKGRSYKETHSYGDEKKPQVYDTTEAATLKRLRIFQLFSKMKA
jgi:hypothetical protein